MEPECPLPAQETRRRFPARPASGICGKPLAEGPHDPRASAAAQVILDTIKSRGTKAELSAAFSEYRDILLSLAEGSPGIALWQVERAALPEHIRNQPIRVPGLPRSLVPISFIGWENERLECVIDALAPKNGPPSAYVRMIARLLDRYVQSFFPSEQLDVFYLPSVMHLHTLLGQDGVYEEAVVAMARPLAVKAYRTLSDTKTNPLKMPSHKSISIETGVHLSEQHSSSHKRFMGKPGSGYGRRFIGTSVTGSMGLFYGERSLRPLLGARLGLPGFEDIIKAQNIREIATREELTDGMSTIIRTGKGETFSHPSLPGMEFSDRFRDFAVDIAIAAQASLTGGNRIIPHLLYSSPGLSKDKESEFSDACGLKDRMAQMALALEIYAIEAHAQFLWGTVGIKDAYEQAVKDFETARGYVEEYRNPPSDASMVLRGVREMQKLAREPAYYDVSDFELAFAVINQRHMKSEPLSTIRPPSGSMPPAASVEFPKPALMPSDLAPPAESPAEPQEAAAPGAEPEAGEAETAVETAAQEVPAATVSAPGSEAAPEPAQVAAPAPAQQVQAAQEPSREIPKFDFPFPNHVYDTELEPLLPPKTDKRNGAIRLVARALVSYKVYGYADEDIDPRCLVAVQSLKTDYSPAAALDFAILIVDGKQMRKVAPTLIYSPAQESAPAKAVAPTAVEEASEAPAQQEFEAQEAEAQEGGLQAPEEQEPDAHEILVEEDGAEAFAAPEVTHPDIRSAGYYLSQMEESEKDLVAGAMKSQACEEDVLSRFLALRPARQEMLIESFIASRWTEGDFKVDIARLRRAKEMLHSTCGLEAPTAAEKLAEITDPANLLESQRRVIGQLFQTGTITAKHVEAFRVWVSSDPSTESGLAVLAEYWNKQLVAAGPSGFNITSGMWARPSREDRLRYWHVNARDAVAAGSLAHKLRFARNSPLSMDEIGMISHIYGKSWADASVLSQQSRDSLAMALTNHVYSESRHSVYYPEVLAVAKTAAMEGPSLVRKAARDEAEYNLLLDFAAQVRTNAASGMLVRTHGTSQAKRPNGVEKPNEDSWTSAIVALADGTDISLDMVADGMGGHTKGSNGGLTNGQAASGMAREIFEIAAVAGWIREPEDVRKVILIADQAIVADQIRKKAMLIALAEVTKRWRDSGVDVSQMNPEWMPEFNSQVIAEAQDALASIDGVQINDMGTTMTVAFQRGMQLWFIHCGDSDGKLIRDGRIIFQTQGHSAEYQLRIEAKAASRSEAEDELSNQGGDPAKLDKAGLEALESRVDAIYNAKMGVMADFFKAHANVVSSVLGVKPVFVHINNADTGFKPIAAEDSDIVEVSSDGKSVPVCDHETPIVVFGKCMGNLEEAREKLVALAAERKGKVLSPTLCACKERCGKVDDITLILRYAEEGILERRREYSAGNDFTWLVRRMENGPTELALSKSLRLIIEGAADPDTEKGTVLQLFGAIAENAENSQPRSSREAYSFALSLISTITSMRHDRDELVDDLAPVIGSWSGLMLKKLRECPDASARRRVMFDIASRCVPAEALQPLLNATNPEVASWAGSALGAEPVTGAPAHEMPRPIFNSQLDIHGSALDPMSTRYLDMSVLEIHGSSVVQDTAKRLGLLPRDLEVMVFYTYSDYAPDVALNPHESPDGDNLIAMVGNHLCTGDAERILVASMLLWRFREWPPANAAESKRMARELWDAVSAMDKDSPYGLAFHNKAFAYQGLLR